MSSLIRPLASVAALVGLAAYATIMLRGPQGLNALTEKHQEIRQLEEQNADLRRDINATQKRIDRLQHDVNTQEVTVRKILRVGHAGDTVFVTPDQSDSSKHETPAQ